MQSGTISFIQAADLHLGTSFNSFPTHEQQILRKALESSFIKLMERCSNVEPDFLFIPGDLFDNARPDSQLVHLVIGLFADLRSTQIIVAPGNHDPLDYASPWSTYDWPPHVRIFGRDGDRFDFPEHRLVIHGSAFRVMVAEKPLFDPQTRLVQDQMNLLVLHGELVQSGQPSTYNPIDISWLDHSGMDYAAIGHAHGLLCGTDNRWANGGCLMGRSFAETGDKGWLEGKLYWNQHADVARPVVSIELRHQSAGGALFLDVNADLTSWSDLNEQPLDDYLADVLRRSLSEPNKTIHEHVWVRLYLTGYRLSDDEFSSALLAQRLSHSRRTVTVFDRSTVKRDLNELSMETSLQGAFARRLLRMRDEVVLRERLARGGSADTVRHLSDADLEAILHYAEYFGYRAMQGEVSIDDLA